ncbi:uncharacterized mitochondrial protein AtMg00810-like [Ricinus communis]|uniref:uncharacterized mitochondrial protein AtMg00810-like n=1 Tax=Ricinus communis TaxID=3988 RepID=UPI00201A945D|nr:uncharacterized mitochondrial protein AtMg00810-like [Ricinus communis]
MDNFLIFGSNIHLVNDVISMLYTNFDIKDLEDANVFLGIKITRPDKGISLDQSHYIKKILKKYNYSYYKPACTPYDPSVKLFKNTGDSIRQSEYVSVIGSLRYVTDCTKVDIAFAVGLICRFTNKPRIEHWHTVKKVMRCLKRTMSLGLFEGYNDAY